MITTDANNNKILVMPTTIANTSKETISRLIRSEFDKCTNFWQREEAINLIKTAREFSLNELANEMQKDL